MIISKNELIKSKEESVELTVNGCTLTINNGVLSCPSDGIIKIFEGRVKNLKLRRGKVFLNDSSYLGSLSNTRARMLYGKNVHGIIMDIFWCNVEIFPNEMMYLPGLNDVEIMLLRNSGIMYSNGFARRR